jgi:hypothetical protein
MPAMYGDITGEFSISADGSTSEITWKAGPNRRLRVTDPETGEAMGGHHPYISAVAVLHRRLHASDWAHDWLTEHRSDYATHTELVAALMEAASKSDVPPGDELYLDVFETVSDIAVPLPRELFNGPDDRRWFPTPTTLAWIHTGRRIRAIVLTPDRTVPTPARRAVLEAPIRTVAKNRRPEHRPDPAPIPLLPPRVGASRSRGPFLCLATNEKR